MQIGHNRNTVSFKGDIAWNSTLPILQGFSLFRSCQFIVIIGNRDSHSNCSQFIDDRHVSVDI